MLHTHEISDAVAGPLTIEYADDGVLVFGDTIPSARVTRTAPESPGSGVPIGTRNASHLDAYVGDSAVHLHPWPGRIMRRSYRVDVRSGDRAWVFTPSAPHSTRLVRGPRHRRSHQLGVFTRLVDGDVGAHWSGTPEPFEVALGYLLAAAFDTGADLAVEHLWAVAFPA